MLSRMAIFRFQKVIGPWSILSETVQIYWSYGSDWGQYEEEDDFEDFQEEKFRFSWNSKTVTYPTLAYQPLEKTSTEKETTMTIKCNIGGLLYAWLS